MISAIISVLISLPALTALGWLLFLFLLFKEFRRKSISEAKTKMLEKAISDLQHKLIEAHKSHASERITDIKDMNHDYQLLSGQTIEALGKIADAVKSRRGVSNAKAK